MFNKSDLMFTFAFRI